VVPHDPAPMTATCIDMGGRIRRPGPARRVDRMVKASAVTGVVAVVIPVKAFSQAKRRLEPVLDGPARAELARTMAATVVAAARPLRTAVVCDDDEVRTWALSLGAEVIWTPGVGLNGAVAAAVEQLGAEGVERVIVAHADLPLATDLTWVAADPGVTLVPDRHGDGTNVACVPTGQGFTFAYGPASCSLHEAEARRLGLAVRVVPDARLGWDVDRPADLDLPADLTDVPCR
jgi:2-phospho-L-lactate guanylyltransferase